MPKQLTIVQILIGMNVILFMGWNALQPDGAGMGPLGLYLPGNPHFGVWQYLTSMFMHGGTGHLLMNMFGLYMFGSVLEKMWGAKRFVIFYLAAGLGAGLIYSAVTHFKVESRVDALVEQGIDRTALEEGLKNPNPNQGIMGMFMGVPRDQQAALEDRNSSLVEEITDLYFTYNAPMVGASGALYGILTAFGILYPNVKLALMFLPVPIAAKYFIPILLLMDLFSGITGFSVFGGGIAHFAHLGGALIGFLLMLRWRGLSRPEIPWSTSGQFE